MSGGIADRFELIEVVGRGAFAEVWRALDRENDGAVVALKRLHAHMNEATIRQRFLREARLLSKLEVPQVVRYVAHGEDSEGRAWLALEWLDGEDLARRQSRAPLNAKDSLALVREAALGLDALHRAGIVHRDVKPSNFYVTTSDSGALSVKLIDLGVARAPAEGDITLDGVRIGTPSYMSPEQARGEERITHRSDVFSLAVVLYELLAGRKPFVGSDPFAVLARIVLEDPPRLKVLVPTIPDELERAVVRAMSRDPALRFDNAREFADALAAVPEFDRDSPSPSMGEEAPTAMLRPAVVERSVERRVMTTIFAGLAKSAEPEESQRAFERVVAAHQGISYRLVGKRMLAVFGAARSGGDEAVRAARAALAFRGQCHEATLSIATGRGLSNDAALSTEVIDRGARAHERAGMAIGLDEATARSVQQHFVVEGDEGERVLRGERASATAVSGRLLGREVPIVGRDREIELLEAAYDRAAQEKRSCSILVLGAAGIGKSRVRVELLRRIQQRATPFAQLVLRCDPMLSDVPYGVLARALRHRAAIDADVAPSVRDAALGRWARALGLRTERAVLRALFKLDDGPADESQDGNARRAELRDGACEIALGLARQSGGTLLLLIEDVQWADEATLDAAQWTLEANEPGQRVVALGLGRPESTAKMNRLWGASLECTVELAPLSEKDSETLVRAAIGDQADEVRVRAVVERAMGNPLFVEELVRNVRSGDSELPVAIQAAFQVRLDALAPIAKRAALVASVLGNAVWPDALTFIDESIDADAALGALVHTEVLAARARARLGRRGEFVWRHALLREAAYAMLSPAELRKLHGAAARWLRSAGERDEAVLAEHHARAGEVTEAATGFLTAGHRAIREGSFDAVRSYVDRALVDGVDGETRASLHSLGASATHPVGRYAEALKHTAAGLACSRDPARRLELAAQRALTLRRTGGLAEAEEVLEATLAEIAPSAGDEAHEKARLGAEVELAWLDVQRTRYDIAVGRASAALARLTRLGADVLGLSARHCLAQALHGAVELQRALAEHRALIEKAESLGLRWRAEGARVGLGQVLLALGLDEAARRELDLAAQRAESTGLRSTMGFALHQRGRCHARLGALDGARDDQRRAIAVGEALGNPLLVGSSVAALACAELARGDFAEAGAQSLAALAQEKTPRGWRAAALAVQASLAARQGDTLGAIAKATEAASAIDEGDEDEGDETAVVLVLAACARCGADALAREVRASARRRFESRLARVSDPALRSAMLATPAGRASRG